MPDIMRWNPYDDLARMREDFGRIFAPLWGHAPGVWGPSMDIAETDTHVEVSAEIPGVDPGELDLTISEDGLTLRGVVKQASDTNQQGYRRIERRYGSFQRSIAFPVPVQFDQATADYENGILHIRIPKAASARSKSIKLDIGKKPPQLH